ncbi:MAG: sulfur carrier protein ThiS [Pyrinomonadaceae bacterium]|nr:sulfur carrier protein ThiS [Pyrinomonadaceae bacterium]
MIEVLINGKNKSIDANLNLRDLLTSLDLTAERIAVELNKDVVRKGDWENTTLAERDQIEIIHFVGGG